MSAGKLSSLLNWIIAAYVAEHCIKTDAAFTGVNFHVTLLNTWL